MQEKGDIGTALEFLDKWYGDAPRMLVSIVPDGALNAKCLWPQKPDETRDWLRRAIGAGQNIYFSPNQPGWALDKRAEKKDIRTVRTLHVDIDPRIDESTEDCKERAAKALKAYDPPPSVVIDSGNGLQAFWLLEEEIQLDGTPEQWEKLERYNIQLEISLGADSCHNVDRIMRMPGTVNVPNKKKKQKGRVAVDTAIVEELTTWKRYPLKEFTAAPPVQQPGGAAARRGRVEVPGNLNHFSSAEDIPGKLTDYTRMLIVCGRDEDNPTKYPSRSEVLWRVLCDMVRANCDDETIAAVILDPDFKISASVLEKRRPESYAAEQIAAAREEAIDPALRELNERHAVIESDRGGRCVVAEEDLDEVMGRWYIKYQSFDAFRNRYMHRRVLIGQDKNDAPIFMPLGKWWLQNENRRQYRKIVFWPNRDVPPDQYNLWRGFACDAQPGDGHKGFLDHVHNNVCSANQELTDYVINWMARAVQKPDSPGEVALVVKGRKGTGKGFTARVMGSLFGQHYIQVSNAKYVVGDFNAHLRDCVVLFADEAFFAGDKKHESILKALITEPHLTVEAKGIDAEPAPNFLHMIVASNEDWVVPASADERRFAVCEVNDQKMQDSAYFAELSRQLENGGRENLLHYLMRRDISDFEVRDVPLTKGLMGQKILSQSPMESWWYNKLREGRLLPLHDGYDPQLAVDDLYDDYIDEMIRMGNNRRAHRTAFGKFIAKVTPKNFPGKDQRYDVIRGRTSQGASFEKKVRRWYYIFPSLKVLRDTFDKTVGHIDDWDEIEDTGTLKPPAVNAEEPF